MASVLRKLAKKKSSVLFFFLLVLLGWSISPSSAEEKAGRGFGLSIVGGTSPRHHRNVTLSAFFPRAEFRLGKRWNVEAEGNLSHYFFRDEKNLYVIGAQGNLVYTPFEHEGVAPFLRGGGGLGYNNGNGKVREIGETHITGILQGGGGLKFDTGGRGRFRVEYLFHHISDPFRHDKGINIHCFVLGVSF